MLQTSTVVTAMKVFVPGSRSEQRLSKPGCQRGAFTPLNWGTAPGSDPPPSAIGQRGRGTLLTLK